MSNGAEIFRSVSFRCLICVPIVNMEKAASPVKARKMKLQIKHGARKFPVDLSCGMGEVLTVSHLLTKLEELTEVPIDKQKLLYKGKTLKEPKQYLTDVGLTDNAIIMLLGKKPDLTEDKEMQKMNEIEKSMEKQATRLNEITYELDGIHRGFMDEAVRNDALKQIGKNLRGMTESFMKLLESLDGLQLESHNYGGRGKRKTLVDKIQKYLDQCDGLMQGTTDMQASSSS